MSVEQSSPFMTVRECAEYLRLDVSTIYSWVREENIPHRRHGRSIVFHREEIDAWSQARAKPVKGVAPLSPFQAALARVQRKTG
jgi:excisionase family DNA binding protein